MDGLVYGKSIESVASGLASVMSDVTLASAEQ